MKIKQKPSRPERKIGEVKTIHYCYDLSTFSGPINDAIVKLQELRDTPGYYDVQLKIEYDYDSTELHVCGRQDETEEDYEKRLASYNKKLAEYNTWYAANKKKIEKTIEARHEREQKEKNEQIARLEKELKRLRSKRSTK